MAEPLLRPKSWQVVLEAPDARVEAEFWRELLGLVYRPGQEPPRTPGQVEQPPDWLDLDHPDGTPFLAVQRVDRLRRTTWPEATVPQQLHLDLTLADRAELEAGHEQVLALGGELRLDRTDDPVEPLRVYVDPAGHTFCLLVG